MLLFDLGFFVGFFLIGYIVCVWLCLCLLVTFVDLWFMGCLGLWLLVTWFTVLDLLLDFVLDFGALLLGWRHNVDFGSLI